MTVTYIPEKTAIKRVLEPQNGIPFEVTALAADEQKEKLILHLLTHGLSRKEAEDYCNRNIEIADFFAENPNAGYTFVRGNMISYGKKANTG